MLKTRIVSVAACVMLLTAAVATPVSAQMIDRAGMMCGKADANAKFQQEGFKREVSAEVYSTSRGEKWRLEIREANGKLLME